MARATTTAVLITSTLPLSPRCAGTPFREPGKSGISYPNDEMAGTEDDDSGDTRMKQKIIPTDNINLHDYSQPVLKPEDETVEMKSFGGRGGKFSIEKKSKEYAEFISLRMTKVGIDKQKCRRCGETFTSEEKMRKHANKKNCGVIKPKKQADGENIKAKTGGRPKKTTLCEYCEQDFGTRQKMLRHRLDHVDPWKCSDPDCNASFKFKYDLVNHVAKHKGLIEKKKCEYCDYRT
jgi:uncharacterized C2H2 Zn-finger protein